VAFLSNRRAALALASVVAVLSLACGAAEDGSETSPDADASVAVSQRVEVVEPPEELIVRSPAELSEMLENYRLDEFTRGEAIFEPRFITAGQASAKHGGRLMMAFSINGDHRAYSIPFIEGHEVVNDVVGGMPVAITW
jgi:hypothetical protein